MLKPDPAVCSQVREALQDAPGQVEEFVCLLNRFEQVGDEQQVTLLFRKLHCILGNRTDLLRDFAAFLHPEQALQCGLVSWGTLGWRVYIYKTQLSCIKLSEW